MIVLDANALIAHFKPAAAHHARAGALLREHAERRAGRAGFRNRSSRRHDELREIRNSSRPRPVGIASAEAPCSDP